MSFFDEDVDTRRKASSPPRRSARAGGSSEQQTVLVRRGVALAGALVLFLLLALVIGSCRSSARENALKDYNRAVSSVARDSETQVGGPFFELLSARAADGSATDLQTSVSSLRAEADKHLDRAEDLDVPDAMVPAHRSLLEVLELRRDGLDSIAQRVRVALGDQNDAAQEATDAIAGQMQYFLGSDVLYRARVQPLIKQALDAAEIGGQNIVGSRFMPSVEWLSPTVVAARLEGGGSGGSGSGGSGDPADRTVAPGLHGTGVTAVTVGDTTLQPGAANRVTSAGPPTFNVRFTNQGENDEQDVRVDVRVVVEGARAITGSDTVSTIARGATATAGIRLSRAPASGSGATVTVRVRPVPGEEKTDNNEQTFQVLFTG